MSEYDDASELAPGEALPPEVEAELAEALRAAFAPAPLDPARHAELLALALEDPFAPASEEELRASERLRRALDEGDDSHADAALARALRAAVAPEAVSAPLQTRAQAGATARKDAPAGGGSSRGNVVYASFGALALAAAAAFVVWFALPREPANVGSAAVRPTLVQSRTTAPLFAEPFEPGEATARIDRIAHSRERELRENRYALWGVR
jgi:hypothetical protein